MVFFMTKFKIPLWYYGIMDSGRGRFFKIYFKRSWIYGIMVFFLAKSKIPPWYYGIMDCATKNWSIFENPMSRPPPA